MKLFYTPGTCSLAIHILLEEIGKPFDIQKIDFAKQEQHSSVFKAINPKSKIPVLQRDDGSILTELPAIALWLALTNPEKRLFPEDVEMQVRSIELIEYVVSTIHMQGFSRIARPGNFSPNEADHDQIKARGKEIFNTGLQHLNDQLSDEAYFLKTFSVADAVLFFAEFWSVVRLKQALSDNLLLHYTRMKSRPSVQRAVARERLAANQGV